MSSKPFTGVGAANKSPNDDKAHAGALCETQTLYEGPSKCSCCTNWVEEYPEDVRINVEEQEETKQKALVVRMRKNHGEGKALIVDSIVVQNQSLKRTLGTVFEGYKGITPSLKKLVFKWPFRPFFYCWTRLEGILKQQKLDDPKAAAYTQLLYDVLESEFRDLRTEIDDLLANGVITYPLLWALYEPGTRIVTPTSSQACRFYIAESCAYNSMGVLFTVQGSYVDSSGRDIGYVKGPVATMGPYEGTKRITDLPCIPSRFHPDIQEMETMAIARGRRFVELGRGCHYVAYSGQVQLNKKPGQQWDLRVDGRVVVDPATYLKNTPTEAGQLAFIVPLSFGPVDLSLDITERAHKNPSALHSAARENALPTKAKLVQSRAKMEMGQGIMQSLVGDRKALKSDLEMTDEQLMLCNSRVRGYSLNLKQWASFLVGGISEITWNDTAFPNLMLPTGYKDLILSFVEGQAASNGTFDDMIEGKGLGLIVMLAGNPGTGKTLTAEAVADKVRKPLYTLSAGELGQTAESVEKHLTFVLSLAERWDAVLLFDECDVFLQERSLQHLGHNEIVAVFLRVLEYYRGILLMTTNRVDSIDRAFQSRVHLTLHYPDLDADAKEHIWREFVTRSADAEVLTDEEYTRLSQLTVNGREIKNIVKSAKLLAFQQKQRMGMEQIRIVVKATKRELAVSI